MWQRCSKATFGIFRSGRCDAAESKEIPLLGAMAGMPIPIVTLISSKVCVESCLAAGGSLHARNSVYVDESGERTAVVIDLKLNGDLWEDFYDAAVAKSRQDERRIPLEEVAAQLGLAQEDD